MFDAWAKSFKLDIKGHDVYRTEISNSPEGNITRINNSVDSISDKIKERKEQLENVIKQLNSSLEEVEKPFPKEKEYAEKSARLFEIITELDKDVKDVVNKTQGNRNNFV